MNSCDCPIPPGGRATCDDNQLAICRVTNGVAETFCISSPSGGNAAVLIRQLEGYLENLPTVQRRSLLASLARYSRLAAADASTYRNFVLSIIKLESRAPDQPFGAEDNRILASGEHEIGDSVIRFRVPREEEFNPRSGGTTTFRGVPGNVRVGPRVPEYERTR
jgi:hypothetical protein